MSDTIPVPPIVVDVFPESQRYPIQDFFPEPQQPDSSLSFMTEDQLIISWMGFDQVLV